MKSNIIFGVALCVLIIFIIYTWREEVTSKKIDENSSSAIPIDKQLQLGEWGSAGCITWDGEQCNVYVRADKIYTGDDAVNLIKLHNGRKTQLTEETSFVVVEYTTNTSESDAYLNIRICGLDGERLIVDGRSYTTRTYDLDNTEELSSEYDVPVYTHRYAYYEVPDGCDEYVLVFGEHIKELDDVPQAYYKIIAKQKEDY